MDIPNADCHRESDRTGYLQKMSSRGFPYLSQWKRRFCVLSKGCLFVYEKDSSKGHEKGSHVIDLKYYDHVTQGEAKDAKKASNVFLLTSQDRTFFDPGRHLFAADTLTEMHDWITKVKDAIELIRNNNRPGAKGAKAQLKETSLQQQQQQLHQQHQQQKQQQQQQQRQNEESNRAHSRPRSKLLDEEDVVDAKLSKSEEEKSKELFVMSLEHKLRMESENDLERRQSKVSKEGRREESEQTIIQPQTRRGSSTKKITLQTPCFNIETKPQLESITKHRTRGPSGRRAPQSRRQKNLRASSMSALQHEGQADSCTRSGSSLGYRTSTLTADELSLAENANTNLDNNSSLSKSSDNTLDNNLDTSTMNMSFDDIESALFFKPPSPSREETATTGFEPVKKRKSFFSFRNFRLSRSNSDQNPVPERTKSVFRNTTFKFNTFRTSTIPAIEHPDEAKSRRCAIL